MKTELYYERAARGELQAAAEDEDRIRGIREGDRDFLARRPPSRFAAEVVFRRRSRLFRRTTLVAGAAAACLAVVAALPGAFRRDDGIRLKGADLNLFLYRQTASGTELVSPEEKLSAGDVVQLAYYARGSAYAVILSVDGRGGITRHLPLHGTDAVHIDTKRHELLPYSYRLDDAPEYEDVYLIVSSRPFCVEEAAAPLRMAGAGAPLFPKHFRYSIVRITKSEVSK